MKTGHIKNATVLMALWLLLLASAACGDKQGASASTPAPPVASTPAPEPVLITIGDLTDITGPGANALSLITMVLEDMVGYYNEQNLIPGVRLEVISYDGQFDPANDIPGYEWLLEKGADLIFTAQPSVALTLKSRVESDNTVLFTLAVTEESVSPPGYVFSPNALCEHQSYTLLKWIAENDADFPRGRPARIGGVCWAQDYGREVLKGAEDYALAHPEQYEWEGAYVTPFTFTWTPEVEALKDCDYVFPPGLMNQFVEQYRTAGYTARFIGNNLPTSLLGMIDEADLWDEIDGMLFILPGTGWWWNEDGEVIDLVKRLLQENHPDIAEETMRMGSGYLAGCGVYVMLELLADAVEIAGSESFSSQAIFDAAQSFSLDTGIADSDTFSQTKRTSLNYLGIFEARADKQDLLRITPDLLSVVREPG